MLTSPTIEFFRSGKAAQAIDYAEFIRQWREDYAAGRETIPPPENVRFAHDPSWKARWCSIQAQGDLVRTLSGHISAPYRLTFSLLEDAVYNIAFQMATPIDPRHPSPCLPPKIKVTV